jgi:hypothetical protein
MLGIAAAAARSFRMAAPAWKPNVRRRADNPHASAAKPLITARRRASSPNGGIRFLWGGMGLLALQQL